MRAIAAELVDYRDFLREVVTQQIRTRYRSSVLGVVWTLLNPLLLLAVLAFVFAYLNRMDVKQYVPYFFGGYIPWLFFTRSADQAVNSIVGNASLVTRIRVPKSVFPVAGVGVGLIDLAATLLITPPLLVIVGAPVHPEIVLAPLAAIPLIMFTVGIALMFATFNVYLRDFGILWTNVSFLWFFLTPILFYVRDLPPHVRRIIEANPIIPFIRLFQDPIAFGRIPPPDVWVTAFLYAAITLIFGASIFERLQKRFYQYL